MNPSDVVFTFSHETWDDASTREFCRPPDRLVRHLLESPRVRRTLVVNPWRSQLSRLRRRRRFPPPPGERAVLLQPWRLRREDPLDPQQLRASYLAYSEQVRAGAMAAGLQRPRLVTFNPLAAAFGTWDWCASTTYFARDDWAQYPPRRAWWPAYEAAYQVLQSKDIAICAVSEVLARRLHPDAVVVPNGVDAELWTEQREAPPGLPARPLLVYAGTVDERVSLEAVSSILQTLPDAHLLFVGPQTDGTAARLSGLSPRLHLRDRLGQHDLARVVAAADACLLPHTRTELTAAMSPLKLYEYLAAGRPIVATRLPPIEGVHPSVVLVDEDRAFGDGTREALERGPLAEHDRLAFIKSQSWQARFETVLDVMHRRAA